MGTDREGSTARLLNDSPVPAEDAACPAEATDPVADALPRAARAVRSAIAPAEPLRFYLADPSFRIAEDFRRSLLNTGVLGVTTQFAEKLERATRFTGLSGFAHADVLRSVVPRHLVPDAGLAATFAAHRGVMDQVSAALGPLAQLHERHRSLGDLLGVARLPEFVSARAALGHTDALAAVLKVARPFERLDAGIAGMFAPGLGEPFRRDLMGPSLAISSALRLWESSSPVGILAALPHVDAATLGWLRDISGTRAHVQAALVHAERAQRRRRQTRRIELPAEVPCDLCGRPVFDARPPRYITLVGEPPRDAVPLASMCSRCAGDDGEGEAYMRALEALAARDSLRARHLQLEVIRGGREGDGLPRARGSLVRLVFREEE